MELLTCILNDNARHLNYFPENYRVAPHDRPSPMELNAPSIALPVISLGERRYNDPAGRISLAREVIAACSEFGMFEVVDHNIAEMFLWNGIITSEAFFELPNQQLLALSAPVEPYMLYSSTILNASGREARHFWRDVLTLGLDSPQLREAWPSQPPHLKEDVGQFASSVKVVEGKILDLINLGLGLEPNYFNNRELSVSSAIVVNRYPPCPEPTWTCGLPKHADPCLLTISIQRGANGLQIWHNNEWKLVVPSKDALLVTLGRTMETVSNGMLRAAEHRVIVNPERARTSLSYFTGPSRTCIVRTAEKLKRSTPPRYVDYQYENFAWLHIHDHNAAAMALRRMP